MLTDVLPSPLISILSHLSQHTGTRPQHIQFLYSTKLGPSATPSTILFFERLSSIFKGGIAANGTELENMNLALKLFVTNAAALDDLDSEERLRPIRAVQGSPDYASNLSVGFRRFEASDIESALGPIEKRKRVVAYVCGPPLMTDWAVDVIGNAKEMRSERVLCEKWW